MTSLIDYAGNGAAAKLGLGLRLGFGFRLGFHTQMPTPTDQLGYILAILILNSKVHRKYFVILFHSLFFFPFAVISSQLPESFLCFSAGITGDY